MTTNHIIIWYLTEIVIGVRLIFLIYTEQTQLALQIKLYKQQFLRDSKWFPIYKISKIDSQNNYKKFVNAKRVRKTKM